jgi:hypothetical protein
MSARAALRLASRAVAAAWLGAALALLGSSRGASDTAREATARIEAIRLEGEVREIAAKAPAMEPARDDGPEPLRIGAAEIERGNAVLGGGAFPVLVAGYGDFPSFRDYALAMQGLGARLAVVRARRIVGSADLGRVEVQAEPLAGAFSPRARDYADEPELAALARAARERFGAGAEVMMLVPRAIDAGIFGGIAGALARLGGGPDAYREVQAHYLRAPGGGVWLRVDAAVRRDGSRVPLDLLIDLAAAAAPDASAG